MLWWINPSSSSTQSWCWHWDSAFGKCLHWKIHLCITAIRTPPPPPPIFFPFTDTQAYFYRVHSYLSGSLCLSLHLYLFLPQLSCHIKAVVARRVSPGARCCYRVRGESSYLCLSLQSWGAAEWDQRNAGLTPYAAWLTRRSEETLLPFTPLTCWHFFRLREHLKYFNHLKSCSALRGAGETGDPGVKWHRGGIL